MSERWPGGLISRSAPAVVGPTDGEGGSAPGVWTMNQIAPYIKAGTWPLPVTGLGSLYTWGYGGNNSLGDGTVADRSTPVQINSGTTWKKMNGGSTYFMALNVDGTLWTWGKNDYGQMGLNNTTDYSLLKQVGSGTTWNGVAVSVAATLLRKTDGTLWSCGRNQYGQLGLGDSGAGTERSSPTQIGALTNWSKKITGSMEATFFHAIKSDGTLWAWGQNDQGYLGNGNAGAQASPVQIGALTTWVQVSNGGYHAGAIKSDGTLWMWGSNSQGQLGIGNTSDTNSPVQVGALTNWASVSCGNNFTLAVKTNGTLWSWGNNGDGQLGLNNLTNYSSPKQVGALTTWGESFAFITARAASAIRTNGTLYTWGYNTRGILGLGNTTTYSSPKQVGGSSWKSISNAASITVGGIRA